MLKKKSLHRDMADVNVYTARRLKDMAMSLSGLAQAFADEIGGGRQLTKDDGLAAMQTAAAAVCGDCVRCNLYSGSKREDSYYLYYLLRAFEQKGKIDMEDMPRLFNEACRRKDDYVLHLNRNLGRATMNLSWKNRFLESRDTVIVQFRELASILEEFSGQMENATDITGDWEEQIIITRNAATFRFVEEGKYRMLHGVAKAAKGGELISGDNFTIHEGLPRQVIMSLSDGMGSGPLANEDSSKVVELTQQLLETGFSARSALKLVNTVLLLAGTEQNPATLDLCCVDLYTGVLEAMKLGAVPTFIVGHDGVEVLEAGDLPMGVVKTVEPVLLSRKMWDNDRIIMVSDGVLEALPGENKEETLKDFLEGTGTGNPQEMAERILEFAGSFEEQPGDDMTVLVGGVFER